MHGHTYIKFTITSRSILLRMKNISDKFRSVNQNTHCVCNNFYFKSCPLWHNVGKDCGAAQATDDNTAHAQYMLDT